MVFVAGSGVVDIPWRLIQHYQASPALQESLALHLTVVGRTCHLCLLPLSCYELGPRHGVAWTAEAHSGRLHLHPQLVLLSMSLIGE